MFNIASEKMRFKGAKMPGADPGFFLGGGGCTRLLLYFNTNKPHSFFFGRIPVENRRSSQGRGGGVRIYIYIYIYKNPGNSPLDPEQCSTIKERFNSQ